MDVLIDVTVPPISSHSFWSGVKTMTSKPEMTKRQLAVRPLSGYEPEVGRWLWALEGVRRRLKGNLMDLPPSVLDRVAPHGVNSIRTHLYHIAATEMYWLSEVVQQPRPAAIPALLP